jgi:hypothetical protein
MFLGVPEINSYIYGFSTAIFNVNCGINNNIKHKNKFCTFYSLLTASVV